MVIQCDDVYLTDIKWVARFLAIVARKTPLIGFYGELGAGKTTLIRELVEELGVEKDRAHSPTFSIVNEYHAGNSLKVVHIDAYRIANEKEAIEAGIHEYLDLPDAILLVEWAEKITGLFEGKPMIQVKIKNAMDPMARRIIIEVPHE